MIYVSKIQTSTTEYPPVPDPQTIYNICRTAKYAEVDTETDKNGKLYTLQIGTTDGATKVQYIMERGAYPIEQLAPLMSDASIVKILHNAKFDHQVLNEFNLLMTPVYDTFIAECLITNGLKGRKLGLDAVTSKYCNVLLDKSVRGKIIFKGLTDDVIKYAADDVTYLREIQTKQLEIIRRENIEAHLVVECQDTRAYADMEYNGVKFNTTKWNETYFENLQVVQQTEAKLNQTYINLSGKAKFEQLDLFGGDSKTVTGINWNAPKQIMKAFSDCGVPLSTSQEAEIAKFKNNELAKIYLEYSKASTQTSKFGSDYLKFIRNGRLHFNVWQCLDTMRVAMKEPNVSQIPRDNRYRNCFVADDGWVFVDHDYSSQELALIAADSKDPVWLDAVNNNYDLHSVAAELVFKDKWRNSAESDCAYYQAKQKCECKQHKVMRTNVKTINYGLAYGAGPSKLASIMNIPKSEAEVLYHEYFATFPALKNYFDSVKRYIKQNRKVRSMGSIAAIRYFDYPRNSAEEAAMEREGMNARIQMTGACIMKYAVYLIQQKIATLNYPVRFVFTIHDAIVTTTLIEYAEQWSKIQAELMIQASKTIVPDVHIGVDESITPIWKK